MTPVYAGTSAAAPVLRYETAVKPAVEPPPAQPAPPQRRPITYQQTLFTSREVPRVVPFESIAPLKRVEDKAPVVSKARPRRAKLIPGQQALEFTTAGVRRKQREGVIYCDASVAMPMHRSMSAILDVGVMACGVGLFCFTYSLMGGQIALSAKAAPVIVGVIAGLVVFYKLLFSLLGGGNTLGMRWTHLTLVNFDGKRLSRKERLIRMASGVLSVAAAGIGLLWALADEENLTWHDHISKSFPTTE